MPLPSFLQAMFTPQRSGPGQMAWRDRDVGEGSGEISQGDIQEMYWKPSTIGSNYVSGPTTRRLPDPLPGTGGGPNPLAQIGRDMGELAGDDDVDMTSITETALEPGGMSSITEVMQSFGDPTVDELGYGGGGAGYGGLGRGLADIPNVTAFDDTGGQNWEAAIADSVSAPMTTSAPGSFQHMDAGVQDTFAPGYNAGIQDSPPSFAGRRDPTSAVGDFFSNIWERGTGGGTPVPTPGIQPGQTDPATGIPAPIEPHWPEWLRNMFARSTTGGSGRGPRVRR